LQSRRSGFYFAVLREGKVEAGDVIELVSRDPHKVTVADITRLYAFEKNDLQTLRRALQVEALPQSWRDHFQQQLAKVPAEVDSQ